MATNQQPPAPDVNSALAAIIGRGDWRQQLVTDYAETAVRLQAAYGRTLPGLQKLADDLVTRLANWTELNPDHQLRREVVEQLAEYRDLIARVEVEMQDFATLLRNEAGIVEGRAIEAGAQSALELAQAVSGGMDTIIAAAWNRVSPEALVNAIGYVDSTAFRSSIATFGENAAANIGDVILAGVAQGKNPLAISNILQNWFSLPAAWADTTVRTVQIWSYRTASHEAYRQNSDVVTGWMWWASLDDRTCPACISMHGTTHSNDETLDGHHNCRCVALPIVRGTSWSDSITTGEAWFDDQPPEVQRNILGAGGMGLYMADKWDWSKATKHYSNDIFGEMRRASTLGEMTG